MSEKVIKRHLILARQRENRKYNLWLMKNIIKMFLLLAAMTGFAMAVSLIAGLIT